MALTGILKADFDSFYDAVVQAEAKLTSFQGNASKVESALLRMTDSFSGKKAIQEATLMVQAIENLGGVATLTEGELKRVAASVEAATAKMKALGMEVPESFKKIEEAARGLQAPVDSSKDSIKKLGDEVEGTVPKAEKSGSAFDKLGTAIGTFAGNFAYDLMQRGISSIVSMGTEAIATAGKVNDMATKLGISAEAVQGLIHVAEQSGTSIETIGAAIQKLNLNVAGGTEKTQKALAALAKASGDIGVQWDKLRQLSPEQQFFALADALMKVDNHQAMVRLGTELMGKGFADITPAILDDMRRTAEGADKMSNETIQRLADAEDAWAALSRSATIATGEIIGKVLENTQKLADAAKNMTPWERLMEFGPAAAILTNLGIAYGFIDTEAKKATGATREYGAAVDEDRDAAVDDAQAQRDAAEARRQAAEAARKQAEVYRAVDAALARLTAETERQRGALTALGVVTEHQVNKQLEEFALLQEQAAADGSDHDRVLVALLPRLAALAKQAKASGVEVEGLAAAQREAYEAWERLNPAIDDSVQGYVDLSTVMPLTTEEANRLNTIMSPDQWNAHEATEAMRRMGITSRAELQSIADQAERDYRRIVATVGANTVEAEAAFRKMIEAQKLASGELPSYWETNIAPAIVQAIDDISRSMSDSFAGMLTGAVGFKDGFVNIWHSIQQSLQSILSEILNYFVSSFLKGMLGSIMGQQGAFAAAFGGLFGGGGGGGGFGDLIGSALGGLFGGGGGISDLAPNIATQAGWANMLGLGGGGGAAAGGGGGIMGSLGGLFTNPWTAVAGGAAALGLGIWKGGLFRGGEEALKVNPARDDYFQQFVNEYAGQLSAYEAAVKHLSEGGVTGAQTERLLADIYAADSMKEFDAAVQATTQALTAAAATQDATSDAADSVTDTGLAATASAANLKLLETSVAATDLAFTTLTPNITLGSDAFTTLDASVATADAALKQWTAQLNEPPYARGVSIVFGAGSIVVQGVTDPHAIAQQIAGPIVDVILRENPGGARSQLLRATTEAAA